MMVDWQTAIALVLVLTAVLYVIWTGRRWLKRMASIERCSDCRTCPQARQSSRAPKRISLVQLDDQ